MSEINNVVNVQRTWPVPPVREDLEGQADYHTRRKMWALQTALHVDPTLLDPHEDSKHGAGRGNTRLRWAIDRILAHI